MSFSYGFYDSLNHDRMYNAAQFGSIFDGIINDGVYKNYLNGFRVEAGGENKVRVLSGRAWFDHTWSYNSSAMTLDLEKSELRSNRYDMVVIEVNHNREVRANSIKVIKGTSGVNAQKPKPIRSNNINQYPLAYVYRQSGRDTVAQSDITITIGTAECPYIQLAKGLGSSGGSGSQIVEVEETIDDHQGDPIDGSDGQHLTSSITKPVEIPSGPGGDQNDSGCDCDPVNIIPLDKIESIFDYPIPNDPDPERYFLNGPGLNAFVETIKKQNLGGGNGSGGSGSTCVGTGVCLGNETTFSINTIPDTWINNIFDQGLPEDHDENCEHFLDEDGLLTLVNVIKSREGLSSGSNKEESVILYNNTSGSNGWIDFSESIDGFSYLLVTLKYEANYPDISLFSGFFHTVELIDLTQKPSNKTAARNIVLWGDDIATDGFSQDASQTHISMDYTRSVLRIESEGMSPNYASNAKASSYVRLAYAVATKTPLITTTYTTVTRSTFQETASKLYITKVVGIK